MGGFSSSSSKGGGFGSYASSKKKGEPSLLSRLFDNPAVQLGENLVTDVADTVIGIPTGLVILAKDPIATGKAVGRGIWSDYSPLFAGDFKKFGKQVYDHPLGPILDVLSLATLGAGAVGKGAKVLSEAGYTGRRIDALANPVLTRELRSGHSADTGSLLGYAKHSKGYSVNPFIRARQKTAESAVNGLAGLVPSWFTVDSKLAPEVVAGFNGAERADAWRWFREDKYDAASRRHATAGAGSLAIAGIMAGAKRLDQSPAQAARAFVPGIVKSIRDHAHVLSEDDLPQALRVEISAQKLAKMERAERKRFQAEQKAQAAEARRAAPPGTDVVKYDPATAAASAMRSDYKGVDIVKHEGDEVVDSYGVPLDEEFQGKVLDERYAFVHKDAETLVNDFLRRNPNITAQGLADFISGKGAYEKGAGLGGKLVTNDWRKAARDKDGNFLVARNHAKLLEEAANSTHFMAKLGRGITTAWKWAILGIRPAYLINNAVGNYFMYFVSQGPSGLRGLVDAMRQLHGPKKLQSELSKQERAWFRSSLDWQDQYYMGMHRGFAKDASDLLAGDTVRIPIRELGGMTAKAKRIAGTGLYDITHVLADRIIRRAAINSILRKHPEVQKLMKGGMHFDDAAAAVSQNRAIREAVQDQVNDILGQYHYLNGTERAIRAVVPFYTWDRAIARHGVHLYLDRPTTARIMTELGAEGVQTTEELLGEIPDFLRGALPLSLVGMPEAVDGRVPILGTAGYNPYSSLESLIKVGRAMTTGDVSIGEAAASQLNPFLTAAIEQTTGQRLLSGAQLPDNATQGGLVPNVLATILGNLPQVQIADTALTGPRGGPDTLYPGDWQQYLAAYLGFPAKRLNTKTASEIAKRREE